MHAENHTGDAGTLHQIPKQSPTVDELRIVLILQQYMDTVRAHHNHWLLMAGSADRKPQ